MKRPRQSPSLGKNQSNQGWNYSFLTISSLKSQWDVVGEVQLKPKDNPAYQKPIEKLDPAAWRSVSFDTYYGIGIDIPTRPQWSHEMNKEDLEAAEQKHFKDWIGGVYAQVGSDRRRLSYFEHNLEVWRQLWRVCEMADVLLLVADIRSPLIHLPPSLLNYIQKVLQKPVLIVLTKADLISKGLRTAWRDYLMQKYEGISVHFSSIYSLDPTDDKRAKRYSNQEQVANLLNSIRSVQCPQMNVVPEEEWSRIATQNHGPKQHDKIVDRSYITIGFVGQPNVGKSSLINTLFGRKVVSASRTPGHTKHFQTLHLSTHIRVCDSPGLVFPLLMPRDLQVLVGLYNIAQVRDPYGPLLYLAERIPLVRILRLDASVPPDASIFAICEAFALKCGFVTSKAGRPDTYRAANQLLRMVIDGKVLLCWYPEGYVENSIEESAIAYDEEEEEEESGDSDESTDYSDSSDKDVDIINSKFSGGAFSLLASDSE